MRGRVRAATAVPWKRRSVVREGMQRVAVPLTIGLDFIT